MEALVPQARIYAYIINDAKVGTSIMITCQLFVIELNAYVLFDSGATHSFISSRFAKRLGKKEDSMSQLSGTALPSGDILLTRCWLRIVPMVISGRMLCANLIIIDMINYDVILGMDFLGKYNAVINYRC